MFIHPQLSHQPVFTCVRNCQCVFRHDTTVWVCCMGTAQWLLCEVTDSFIMACAHRETAPSRGRREEDRDTGQARFNAGLAAHQSSGWWGRRCCCGGQLLSHLMSLCFSHQLSIYRAVRHFCTHTFLYHTHCLKLSCSFQVIPKSSLIVKLIWRLPLIRPSQLGKL